MANRLPATLAVVMAGLLTLLTAASAETDMTATGTEGNAPAQIAAPAAAPAQEIALEKSRKQKKSTPRSHKKWRTQHSEFVALNQRILDNTFVFNNFADFGLSAFDPSFAERLLTVRETKWAFGRIAARQGGDAEDQAGADANILRTTTIDIQSLNLEWGALHPFFGGFTTPLARGPLLLTADALSPEGEAAGLESNSPYPADAPLAEPGNSGVPVTPKAKGAPFAYRYKLDKMSVNAGVGWIHDLNDDYGTSRAFEEAGYGSSDRVPGLNLSLGASYQAFTLTGGYIRAFDNQEAVQLSLASNETEPVAWNSELAYSTRMLRKETTLAVGYQKSSDALQFYLPEERYRTKASMVLFDATTFSLEYYQDKDLSLKHGGEDEGYGVTTQIGFGF